MRKRATEIVSYLFFRFRFCFLLRGKGAGFGFIAVSAKCREFEFRYAKPITKPLPAPAGSDLVRLEFREPHSGWMSISAKITTKKARFSDPLFALPRFAITE